MTPAEELGAAAEKLRELATAATAGPWTQHDTHLDLGGHTATVRTDREDINQTELVAWVPTWSHQPWDNARNAWNNAAYMATMHPGVGAAVADWLDSYAAQLAASTHPGWHETVSGPPLAVARAILRSQP